MPIQPGAQDTAEASSSSSPTALRWREHGDPQRADPGCSHEGTGRRRKGLDKVPAGAIRLGGEPEKHQAEMSDLLNARQYAMAKQGAFVDGLQAVIKGGDPQPLVT